MVWDQIALMKKMDHPGCPKLNWVYYSQPEFFENTVNFSPAETKIVSSENEIDDFEQKMITRIR